MRENSTTLRCEREMHEENSTGSHEVAFDSFPIGAPFYGRVQKAHLHAPNANSLAPKSERLSKACKLQGTGCLILFF
jgi:hypothetical protein